MKNKEIKQILKEQAYQFSIPDRQKEILSNVKYDPAVTTKRSKRKVGLLFSTLAVVAASLVFIVSFLLTQPGSKTLPTLTVSRAKEMMSYEALALGNIVDEQSTFRALRRSKGEAIDEQEIAQEIHDYLLTGEMMLTKENIEISYNYNENKDYPYTYQLQVTYIDQTTFQSNYTLYFNEERKIKSKKDLDEVATKFEGIMLKDDQEYQIKGEKEVEEDEFEMSMILYKANKKDYIKISQETEINENEFEYEFYENDEKVKELSLEVENKDDCKEMSIKIKELESEKKFEFVYLKDKINCRYERDNDEGEIEIYVFADYYLYRFENTDIKIERS